MKHLTRRAYRTLEEVDIPSIVGISAQVAMAQNKNARAAHLDLVEILPPDEARENLPGFYVVSVSHTTTA